MLASLALTLIFRAHDWSHYIDTIFSFVLSGFLLTSAYMVTADSMYDLLDRSLDESLQMEITRLLVAHFDEYEDLHGVQSRRSGGHVYIEIFLKFDGTRRMAEVQRAIDHITADLENKIPSSQVMICPRTAAAV